MSDVDAKGLREMLARATARPWRVGYVEKHHVFVRCQDCFGPERVLLRMNEHFPHDADAELIVAAVNRLAGLLDENERLTRERDEAVALRYAAQDEASLNRRARDAAVRERDAITARVRELEAALREVTSEFEHSYRPSYVGPRDVMLFATQLRALAAGEEGRGEALRERLDRGSALADTLTPRELAAAQAYIDPSPLHSEERARRDAERARMVAEGEEGGR